ncbi:hypothetical protein BATDEDRAFT_21550 [Batrachochytrium dendrobatidis JAM81]|uniref:Uncharacterized protein n=1 Tax=Batrachochytrium dendrobatidis (strain JAM81 / FGSC 10211) TaxID=684364 RepID=F4NTS5_BATDJ|nr:uncharacterized protein BATDEDRAFT_21550 [Batrachochytrium dendrobatidis JAM81]XP_006675318.1 uncharacterized protein BATDEDRAFT_21551 [Batrachochytrium dendrobatidis JAM81]EGF83130.1 hypothetical protein BATDEDRAFT_21551 [Batrachochytrium dendrobatidis JAM81]EGF83952.1 hypothetical protein BATDEDRAFT_21550 [Batrachochytrium dendrobatidis JAM81]|eukprot:XP_006675317.1 hypothetical protein BATDEDRAFT_21550 [Batrachochytrium dendrobatidis JAM81]
MDRIELHCHNYRQHCIGIVSVIQDATETSFNQQNPDYRLHRIWLVNMSDWISRVCKCKIKPAKTCDLKCGYRMFELSAFRPKPECSTQELKQCQNLLMFCYAVQAISDSHYPTCWQSAYIVSIVLIACINKNDGDHIDHIGINGKYGITLVDADLVGLQGLANTH